MLCAGFGLAGRRLEVKHEEESLKLVDAKSKIDRPQGIRAVSGAGHPLQLFRSQDRNL